MARRSRQREDYSSPSSGSEGEQVELNDDGSRKRRRGGARSKEDAIYGIFAQPDEQDETQQQHKGKGKQTTAKINYRRPQAFVRGAAVPSTSQPTPDDDDEDDEDAASDDESGSSSSSSNDSDESEAAALSKAPTTLAEEMETSSALPHAMLGPTAAEAAARAQANAPGGFKPASFVSTRRAAPGEEMEVDEMEMPARGGIGARSGIDARGGIGAAGAGAQQEAQFARGGIGSRSGIGASSSSGAMEQPRYSEVAPSAFTAAGVPSSFGAAAPAVEPSSAFKPKRSFLPSASASSSRTSGSGATPSFAPGHGGRFAAMMMQQMGWSGGGLGKEGEGIVNPIEVKQRPERAGIAFGGLKEKTQQAKDEARRRGEAVSEDEEERAAAAKGGRGKKGGKKDARRSAREQDAERAQAWTRTEKKPRKPRVEHRTYEQIIEEAGGVPVGAEAGIGPIIDATGAEMRQVSSLSAALAHIAVPTSDSTKLPELRHNLRLVCDNNRQTLDGLAREGARILDRRRWLIREKDESERRRANNATDAARLREVLALVKELEVVGRNERAELEEFTGIIEKLVRDFADQVQPLGLDEAVVGAITPAVRRVLAEWKPLSEPHTLTASFQRWREALRISTSDESSSSALDAYGRPVRRGHKVTAQARSMTPYEMLLWQLWMPVVRSALNNTWRATQPDSAIALLEAWKELLPRFVRDNVTEQLLLPKIRAAVADWDERMEWDVRRDNTPLHRFVFPWLPVLGESMNDVMAEARRKIRAMLKIWKANEGVPKDLARWKEVFKESDWDAMLLSYVVPKLSAYLRADFRVNPASQDLTALTSVISWSSLLRASNLSRLLEADFFPAWTDVLHLWLTQPTANFDEVAQWFSFWKGWFPASIRELAGVRVGFERGLDLINQAMELGGDKEARAKLRKPDTTPLSRTAFAAAQKTAPATTATTMAEEPTISFRRLVEDAAAASDLLVQQLNKSHVATGLPLFRISRGLDGKSGVSFYIDDDVIWMEIKAHEGEKVFEPMSVEELIEAAKAPAVKR